MHEVCSVEVNGERVEQVKEMQYLGVMISGDGHQQLVRKRLG